MCAQNAPRTNTQNIFTLSLRSCCGLLQMKRSHIKISNGLRLQDVTHGLARRGWCPAAEYTPDLQWEVLVTTTRKNCYGLIACRYFVPSFVQLIDPWYVGVWEPHDSNQLAKTGPSILVAMQEVTLSLFLCSLTLCLHLLSAQVSPKSRDLATPTPEWDSSVKRYLLAHLFPYPIYSIDIL